MFYLNQNDWFTGMEEIDFTKYPDKTYQMEWLETFLRFSYEQIGRNPKEVTDVDVETLYVQVNKFALVSCNGFVLYAKMLVMPQLAHLWK